MASKATGHRQGDLRRGAGPVGGTLLDEWYQRRRTLATLDHWPPTGGGDDHAVRLPGRRESPRLLGVHLPAASP